MFRRNKPEADTALRSADDDVPPTETRPERSGQDEMARPVPPGTPVTPTAPTGPLGSPLRTPTMASAPMARPAAPGALRPATPPPSPTADSGGSDSAARKLIVGRDIVLSGEINACDVLLVEGRVEARVKEGNRLHIADCGVVKGTVSIQEADIAGLFEGEIVVGGRLTIRSTGRVVGKIEYSELFVEVGGQIEGEIHGSGGGLSKSAETTGSLV